MLAGADVERRVLAWTDGDPGRPGPATRSSSWCRRTTRATCSRPTRHARIVILTSGTTGTPKGAPRKEAGIDAAVSLLSRMPLRAGWRTHIAAPLFHTWGFAHLALAMLLGSTVVLRRTFDPVDGAADRAGRAVPVDGRDPGDAPADPGARPRASSTGIDLCPRRGRRVVGLGAAGHPRAGLDGPLRRQPLQHLRLHRGGLRLDRDARGPARRPDARRASRRTARS